MHPLGSIKSIARPTMLHCSSARSLRTHWFGSVKNVARPTLFHCVGARSLRTVWLLQELGNVPYDLVTMPFPPRAGDFRKVWKKVNPLGTIPFLAIGEDVRMTESCGTLLLLSERFDTDTRKCSLPPSHPGYADLINFVTQADATLTFPQTLVLRYEQHEPQRGLQEVSKDYRTWFLSRLRTIDLALADGRQFLVDNRFTIADIAVGYALFLGERIALRDEYSVAVQTYLDRLMALPSFKRAREEELKSLNSFKGSMDLEAFL